MNIDEFINTRLAEVQKPSWYVGGEYGSVVKNKEAVNIRFAFCFPDMYDVGMSHLGMKILYHMMNDTMPDVWCERVFMPNTDMQQLMRENDIPLFGLESHEPIKNDDFVGFTLQYELSYTNIVAMLDLAGVPIFAKDRKQGDPIVICGGPCACNPEPISDFVDIFFIGDGEEDYYPLFDIYRQCGKDREEFLRRATEIDCMYVPKYHKEGQQVNRRIIKDINKCYIPDKMVVPYAEIVHDRVVLEIMRGCIRGCRFCQAGMIYRPFRQRSPELLVETAKKLIKATGYDEISLTSLSTSDFEHLDELADSLLTYCVPQHIDISLPSLRVDNFTKDLLEKMQSVRKSGLTFAPEAGTQRLRDVINKNVTEEDLLRSCAVAFQGGWNSVKLYFMLGLPTETDEDVLGIAELADRVVHCWRENSPNRSHGLRVTVSTSCFVPKPHTPFQWEPQVTREEYMRRVTLLRDNMKARAVTYNWHDADTSLTEAVLSRGDRRLGAMIENIWRQGGFLESWSEGFDLKRWERAAEEEGISFPFYANRERSLDEVLPWDHLYMGVNRRHYIHEYEQAHQGLLSPDCRAQCSGCGAAAFLKGGRCDG
mgnify:CR=1 FL=1